MTNSTSNTYTLKRKIFYLLQTKFQNTFPNQIRNSLPTLLMACLHLEAACLQTLSINCMSLPKKSTLLTTYPDIWTKAAELRNRR